MDAAAALQAVFIVAGGVAVLGGAGYALYRVSRTGAAAGRQSDGGVKLPVAAAFTGVRGMPWWYAVAVNNAAPLLVIYPDAVLCRVIRRKRRPFSAIESIDVNTGPATVNVRLQFRGERLTFSANVRTRDAARAVLMLLPVEPMTDKARAIRGEFSAVT